MYIDNIYSINTQSKNKLAPFRFFGLFYLIPQSPSLITSSTLVATNTLQPNDRTLSRNCACSGVGRQPGHLHSMAKKAPPLSSPSRSAIPLRLAVIHPFSAVRMPVVRYRMTRHPRTFRYCSIALLI